MFILPERPKKENPLNTLMTKLEPIAGQYMEKRAKDKLEDLLAKAKTPEDRQHAIEKIMLSPHYSAQEKSSIERMFHQERDSERKQSLMRSLFGDEQASPQQQTEIPQQEMESPEPMMMDGEGQQQGSMRQMIEGEDQALAEPSKNKAQPMPSKGSPQPMTSEQQAPQAAKGKMNPADLTDEQIMKLSVIDPAMGNTARQLKESNDKKKMENYKLIAPLEKEVYQRGDAARKSLQTMNYLEELENSGGINNPAISTLLEKVGMPWLMNNETIAYKSAVLEEMDNLKKLFGSRPTVLDVQMYLESLPNIKMNPEARKKIIQRKRQLANVALIDEQAFNAEMQENPNPIGFNQRYRELSEEMVDKALSELKDSWIKEDSDEEGMALVEKNGQQFTVPKDQIKKAEASGARLVRG